MRIAAQVKLANSQMPSMKELTKTEKLEIKYGIMFETLNELQGKEREFDKYVSNILR